MQISTVLHPMDFLSSVGTAVAECVSPATKYSVSRSLRSAHSLQEEMHSLQFDRMYSLYREMHSLQFDRMYPLDREMHSLQLERTHSLHEEMHSLARLARARLNAVYEKMCSPLKVRVIGTAGSGKSTYLNSLIQGELISAIRPSVMQDIMVTFRETEVWPINSNNERCLNLTAYPTVIESIQKTFLLISLNHENTYSHDYIGCSGSDDYQFSCQEDVILCTRADSSILSPVLRLYKVTNCGFMASPDLYQESILIPAISPSTPKTRDEAIDSSPRAKIFRFSYSNLSKRLRSKKYIDIPRKTLKEYSRSASKNNKPMEKALGCLYLYIFRRKKYRVRKLVNRNRLFCLFSSKINRINNFPSFFIQCKNQLNISINEFKNGALRVIDEAIRHFTDFLYPRKGIAMN